MWLGLRFAPHTEHLTTACFSVARRRIGRIFVVIQNEISSPTNSNFPRTGDGTVVKRASSTRARIDTSNILAAGREP